MDYDGATMAVHDLAGASWESFWGSFLEELWLRFGRALQGGLLGGLLRISFWEYFRGAFRHQENSG